MNVTLRIDGTDPQDIILPLPIKGRAGVAISGGLDSAVLLHALLHVRKVFNVDFDVKVYTVNRSSSPYHASQVVGWLSSHFRIPINTDYSISNEGSEDGKVNKGLERVFQKDDIDLMYTGLNQNPPVSLMGLPPVRLQSNPAPNRLAMPFLHLYKTHIITLAEQLGALPLLELTHSCTESPYVPCRRCFQCNERQWGFQELGLTDPATEHA